MNCATFRRISVACIASCLAFCCRFVDEVIVVLGTNGVNTWKQFQSCKLDDIEFWPAIKARKFF